MKIGIDIDDTVMNTFDIIEEAARYFDKYFLENKGYQDITKYDFHERFYWTSEEKKAFFNYFRKNKLYLKAKPKGDALYYLEKLYNEGYEIYFLTRRKKDEKLDILSITKNDLISKGFKFTDCYIGLSKKGEACKNLGIDVFIDDAVIQIEDVNNYGIKTILIDNWYNKEYKGLRAKNFQEIYNIIRKWNNAR
ncbi:putative uncharacterized protein [Mycoplasma sp. CAG:956]|nr:putative uncharacterized protein [Mycoplasma sp. CAG:956]